MKWGWREERIGFVMVSVKSMEMCGGGGEAGDPPNLAVFFWEMPLHHLAPSTWKGDRMWAALISYNEQRPPPTLQRNPFFRRGQIAETELKMGSRSEVIPSIAGSGSGRRRRRGNSKARVT